MSQFSVLDILSALGESGGNPALSEISKAMTSFGAGTELSALTGGGAFRIENMDPVLASATVRQEHFKFFKRLMPNRRYTFSIVDQAVVKTDIGAFFGSANSDEVGSAQQDRQGTYNRLITQLGMYFSRRSVSIATAQQAVLQNKNGVVDFSAIDEEDINSALEILMSLEYDLFFGDNAANSLVADGIITRILAQASENSIDMWGEPLQTHIPFSTLAGQITSMDHWGKPTLAFMSSRCKQDLDAHLETGYRVNLDSRVPNVEVGTLVKGMQYSSVAAADGMLDFDPHAFLTEDLMPVVTRRNGTTLCTGGVVQGVVAAASVGAEAASQWLDKTTGLYKWTVGGDYIYAVEAYSVGNVSQPVKSNTVTVAATHNVSLAITPSATNNETYYKIYRSRKNGTNAYTDMRLVATVKKNVNGQGVTVWTDNNIVLPGSSYAVELTMMPESLRWVSMLPMTKVPFALNDLAFKWGTFLIGALRISLPQHHGVIRNIIPSTATWLPF